MLCTFWVPNVLRATSACIFSTSELPRLLRHWGALAFWVRNLLRATRACNFLFLISPDGSTPATLASLLTDPPEPQNIGKHGVSRLFYFFRAPASSFFWLFSDSLFSSLIFSDPSHLCFFICLIVGSLTSKFRRFLCVCDCICCETCLCHDDHADVSYTILYIFFSVDMHIHVYMSSYIFLSWTISSKLAQPKQRRVFSVFLMLQANWWAPAAGFANCLYLREPQCFGIQGLDHLTSCD